MLTVVLEPFSDVHDTDIRSREAPRIKDKLMSTEPVLVSEHDRVVLLQAFCHVVSIQDGNLQGFSATNKAKLIEQAR